MFAFCSLRNNWPREFTNHPAKKRQGKDVKTTTLSIWLWTHRKMSCIESLLKQYLHLLLPILPYRLRIGVIRAT